MKTSQSSQSFQDSTNLKTTTTKISAELKQKRQNLHKGNLAKYEAKLKEEGKFFVRERLNLLFDAGSIVEDGLLANCLASDLPSDGVVTGIGLINGRKVCFMANDSTVKAGSWGARTVEKIIRIQETAQNLRLPLIYLVDSAGARITDQIEMFPGRRGAGRIFRNQINLSGYIPQICLLFGPSAAGGAYIPAFCDIVVMNKGNASMYLGSPRMAQMVIGEKVTLEEMGGATMHCSVSGCGDVLVNSETEAIEFVKKYLQFMPDNCHSQPDFKTAQDIGEFAKTIEEVIPYEENIPFDMHEVIKRIIDNNSFLEIKTLFAPELITGFARLSGRAIGIIANQPKVKGGVLFPDSADKATRFIWLCDAFNIPLLFLADVPGFMIGTKVEKAGIIRNGAKMISAVSSATVPKISVIIRKAYGAGLYAMCGPAFDCDACIALPTAWIAVMGPEAAVNAVYYNKIMELPQDERNDYVLKKRDEYRQDVNLYKLASELIVDDVVEPLNLRDDLIKRFAFYENKSVAKLNKKISVLPV